MAWFDEIVDLLDAMAWLDETVDLSEVPFVDLLDAMASTPVADVFYAIASVVDGPPLALSGATVRSLPVSLATVATAV
jgi:hypothetical protein